MILLASPLLIDEVLFLGLLSTGSSPPAAGLPPGQLSAAGVVAPERCTELRETEAALAAHEVHLLDQLALPDAAAWERDAWRHQLAYADDSLEGLDKALEADGCPTH
jgi:hypothetical protein